MEENVVDMLQEKVSENVSPKKKVLSILKKIVATIVILKWLVEILKFIGKIIAKAANQSRRSLKLSITDRYDEGNVWVTIIWIRFWAFVYGLVAMFVFYYLGYLEYFLDWINTML